MRERLRFMLIYFAFWSIYFLAARVIFLSYHIEDSKTLTLETVFGIFWHGFRMDLSMAGYLCIFPFLWVTISNFLNKSLFQNTIFSYTFFLIFVITLIIVVDLEVYNIWSFRLDATPLAYLKSPKEAWASVKNSPVIPLIISTILLVIVASSIVYRIMANKIYDWKHIKNFPFIIYGLLMVGVLIIPIRGGFGIAPMNHSTVYFSKVNFANISAINAPWNFFSSIIHNSSNKVNPYTYLPKESLDTTIANLYKNDLPRKQILKQSGRKPNVLIIIWESFTKKVVDQKHNEVEITPNFNKLKSEGIYFSDFYAMGDRTDKAITSILSGFPTQPTESIIKYPTKTATLPVLSKEFGKNGFSTQFYYGGDTEFANIKSYLFNANFEKIVDMNDFPAELATSKWGVHDEYIFDKFLEDHKVSANKPFFSSLLTLSSHEPFETTQEPKIKGETTVDLFMNSLNYSDQCLGNFIEKAKKTDWWNNTLVIIVGDHGHKLPETANRVDDFKIPMLWTGGAVNTNWNYKNIASQIDISATLLGQMNFDASAFYWSKDLFKTNTKPWAFFVFNDGFGFIKPRKEVLFDNKGKLLIQNQELLKSKELMEGKALQQKSYQDFLAR
ncbi:LTA synthase family protein [Lacihabitans soyangensis]|uniref:Alkaline phosphatase family protein n=1 Tax=Lacihabitans soyangensis TaxID=869394 RepID=A0AAE3H5R0_9BACT|nr:alkaline phosphatase family protein [Lacihabitans soyangensis]MCP9765258.1 alkaline phosphatase family protein [Lacihabitans soyangensis]